MSIIFDHDEDDDDDDYMKPHIEHTVMPLPNAEDKKKRRSWSFAVARLRGGARKHLTSPVCVCVS